MKNNTPNQKNHAPGTGSDKHHPETPPHADERFNKQPKKNNTQDNPGSQNSG